MAQLQVNGDYSFNMAAIDYSVLFSGAPIAATKKMYVLEFGDGTVDFRGTGFKYAKSGEPRAGDVEGYAITDNFGDRVFSFGGFDVSVKAFVNAASTISTTDDRKLLASMLSGNDTLKGADLADGLMGFGGKDTLYGAGGADEMMGGSGNDRYVYLAASESTLNAIDTIFGFAHGDKISLSAVAEFEFIGQTAYTGTGAEVAWTILEGDTYVIADADGDMDTDLAIKIDGEITLSEADFLL